MAGFKVLKDVCVTFNEQLQQVSDGLFSVKVAENSEELLAKKCKDLALFSAKYRLLHAKTTAQSPQILERVQNSANIIDDYEETVQNKVVEQMLVKGVTQRSAVQRLLATPDRRLDEQSLDKKKKLIEQIKEFNTQETQLRQLSSVLRERQSECSRLMVEWDGLLGEMRVLRESAAPEKRVDTSGPLYQKLKTVVSKMQMMSWLISRLVPANAGQYDWLADPKDLLSCLPLTRDVHTLTVQHFISK